MTAQNGRDGIIGRIGITANAQKPDRMPEESNGSDAKRSNLFTSFSAAIKTDSSARGVERKMPYTFVRRNDVIYRLSRLR